MNILTVAAGDKAAAEREARRCSHLISAITIVLYFPIVAALIIAISIN